ncbi:MAG: NurA nuclease domain protein [candidate division TM6 bacterium GW2011_GWF2_32_72]|nr:MAG: NurA nuclease domain protein [candidate division TM6 bacterium GW2011_GWF2_32_72]
MLNHLKTLKELERVSDKLFPDVSGEINLAKELWNEISNDPTFIHQARAAKSPWNIPYWQGGLSDKFVVDSLQKYKVLAVDGSQIYPDRHQGVACYLINVGIVFLDYFSGLSSVKLDSEPFVFVAGDGLISEFEFSMDLVNCHRQEFEFKFGCDFCKKMEIIDFPFLFLFDGSLIFWHLDSKEHKIKEYFLSSYLNKLEKLYEKKILNAGYISFPKSKDLVNLLRLKVCNFQPNVNDNYHVFDRMTDAVIIKFFLPPFKRSIVFQNNSKISEEYPDHLRPYFFYLNVEEEIARIEIPKWIADDLQLVDQVAKIVVDQVKKGDGYPISIAESHEQAVVKSQDRNFFYDMIFKQGIKQDRMFVGSRKSFRKKNAGF